MADNDDDGPVMEEVLPPADDASDAKPVSPHAADAVALFKLRPAEPPPELKTMRSVAVPAYALPEDDPEFADAIEKMEEAEANREKPPVPAKPSLSTLASLVPPPKTASPFQFAKPAAKTKQVSKMLSKEAEAKQKSAEDRQRRQNEESNFQLQQEAARAKQRAAASAKVREDREQTAKAEKDEKKQSRRESKPKKKKSKKSRSSLDLEADVDDDDDIIDDGDGEEPEDGIDLEDDVGGGKWHTKNKEKHKRVDTPRTKEEASSVTAASNEDQDNEDDDTSEAFVQKLRPTKAETEEKRLKKKQRGEVDRDEELEARQQIVDTLNAADLQGEIEIKDAEIIRLQRQSEIVNQKIIGATRKRKALEEQISVAAAGGAAFVEDAVTSKAPSGESQVYALERMFTQLDAETPYDRKDKEERKLREELKDFIRQTCEAVTEADSACHELGRKDRKRARKEANVVWQLKYNSAKNTADEKSARIAVTVTCTDTRFEYTGHRFSVIKARSEAILEGMRATRNSWEYLLDFYKESADDNLKGDTALLAIMYYVYRCILRERFSRAPDST